MSEKVKKLLKKHDMKYSEFEKFRKDIYEDFPANELTIAQHFLQTKGVDIKNPAFQVRGDLKRIRDLESGEFCVVIAAIGAEQTEPMKYRGCKEPGCFSRVDDEGNCTKRDQNGNNVGHGYQGMPEKCPEYVKRFYEITDGPEQQDKAIAQIRHDVNDGEPLSGLWKLKGVVFDNGDFFTWAGVPLTAKQAADELQRDEVSTIATASDDNSGSGEEIEIDEDDVPDFSYLEEEEEEEEVEDIEPKIPEDLLKKVKTIMKKEKVLPKTKLDYFLESHDAKHLFDGIAKELDLVLENGDVKAPWAEKE